MDPACSLVDAIRRDLPPGHQRKRSVSPHLSEATLVPFLAAPESSLSGAAGGFCLLLCPRFCAASVYPPGLYALELEKRAQRQVCRCRSNCSFHTRRAGRRISRLRNEIKL